MSDSASAINLIDIDSMLSSKTPQEILRYALENHDNIAISFSGAEDVALVDMAHRIRSDIQVFSLDTGRLHAETYRFIEKVRKHYGIAIDLGILAACMPKPTALSKRCASITESQ